MSNVGQNIPRRDGEEKVTGEARYVDDMTFENMLHGATIRTTEPRARLDKIVYDEGYDWGDIVRVDASDIPGKNTILLMTEDQPALVPVGGVSQHAEEAVALIAAETREAVLEARRHVRLETTPLRPVFDPDEALQRDDPIYGDDNVFKAININKGDVPSAMAAAPHTLESEFRVGHQEQMYIEPQGVIGVPNDDGGVTIYGSLQCPYYVQKALKPLLDLPPEKVRVIATTTGGAFGGKEDYPSMIGAHAALLALKAGRPVKIIYDRSEDIAATTKRHPAIIRHKTGFNDDGVLVAMDIDLIVDGGAYLTLSPVVLSRAAIHATGPYRCDNVAIRSVVVATNTPPNGAFRGFGAPQACFAIERQLDRIGAAIGKTPLEMRRINMLRPGDTTATSQLLEDSVGSEGVLETVVERSKYTQRWSELSSQDTTGRLRRGIGLSFTLHGAGFTGNGEAYLAAKADVELTDEGGVRVLSGSTEMGQGCFTVFSQIAADALKLPIELVSIGQPDTANVPDSGPTAASRTTMVVGKVVENAAKNLLEELSQSTANVLGLEREQLLYENGVFSWEGGEKSFQEAARVHLKRCGPLRVRAEYEDPGNLVWDMETYTGDAYPCYAWAADVAEVEVDLDTYVPKVLRFYSAHDIGKAIHPVLVAGQIEGGSLQGIGGAFLEELKIENGRFINHRMTDCIIPTALDAPEMEVYILEYPFKHGPQGAKGFGELPADLPAPAVLAAIEQATGVSVDQLPYTPEALCRDLNKPSEGDAS